MSSAIYIKDANNGSVSFIDLILDRIKLYETRKHKRLPKNKWIGIAKNNLVYGEVILGKPVLLSPNSPEYMLSYIANTDYDCNNKKYYYPIIAIRDFRNSPKQIVKHGHYAKY